MFENPTEHNPVETSEFLSHLHLGFLDQILRELFPRLERIKPEVYARIRLVLFMKLQGIRSIYYRGLPDPADRAYRGGESGV